MDKKNLIFFQGKTQYENTGDVLINKALIQLLRERGEVIINDKDMPSSYVDSIVDGKHECISSRKTSFSSLLLREALKGERPIFLIAGPPGHLFGNSAKRAIRNYISGLFLMILQFLGVKIIKIGFSIGPVGKKLALSERFRATFTDYYLVRDSLSLALSRRIGITKADFFPDLAWMYSVTSPSSSLSKKKVILSFRDSVFEGNSDPKYLDGTIEALRAIMKANDKHLTFEVTYQVKRDYSFSKKIYDVLKDEVELKFHEDQITLENADIYYKDAVCIITNRLHGALLANKYGALPIILTDSKDHLKIKGIFTDAGIDNLILDINEPATNIQKKFLYIVDDYNDISAHINDKTLEYQFKADEVLTKIFQRNEQN